MIWPERDATQARKLLSEALYVIRRELGVDVIDAGNGDQVTLSNAVLACDLWQFDAAIQRGELTTAVELSTAPFLDGMFLDEAEEFDRWLQGERRRVALERERALLSIAATAEQATRWLDAARAWQQLLQDDPYSARFVVGATNALVNGGERPAALQLLSSYEERLQRELEVAPEPEVQELAAKLREERVPGERLPVDRTRLGGRLPVERSLDAPSLASISQPLAKVSPADRAIYLASASESGERIDEHAPQRRRTRRWLVGAVAAVAAVVLGFAGWTWMSRETPETFDARRLAVLYFRDGSPEGDLGSVADLLTESVIEQLAGSPAFEVIPVSGVRQVRDGSIGLDSIARRFRVGSMIDGALHRRGENLVVRVRLVDAETGAVVWSSSLERNFYQLFALEEEVARELAIGVRQRLGREIRLTQLQRESSNVRAWRLVARGNREREDARRIANRGMDADSAAAERGIQRADSLYEQAAIEDPNWVRPVIERAWTAMESVRWLDAPSRLVLVEQAIARTDSLPARLRVRPDVVEARSALRWLRLKWLPPPLDAAALSQLILELETAVEQEPELARAWATLSNIYWVRGEVERSEQTGRRALAADAYIEEAPSIYRTLFASALYRGVVDSASVWCGRGRYEYPDDWWFRECQLTVMKYDLDGPADAELAWRLVAETDSLDPPERAAAAGHAYSPIYRRMVAAAISARAGDAVRARNELERQRQAVASDSLVALDMVPDEVTLLLQFGERAAAVERLRWAVQRRPLLGGIVGRDPILRTLADALMRDTTQRADSPAATTVVPKTR